MSSIRGKIVDGFFKWISKWYVSVPITLLVAFKLGLLTVQDLNLLMQRLVELFEAAPKEAPLP